MSTNTMGEVECLQQPKAKSLLKEELTSIFLKSLERLRKVDGPGDAVMPTHDACSDEQQAEKVATLEEKFEALELRLQKCESIAPRMGLKGEELLKRSAETKVEAALKKEVEALKKELHHKKGQEVKVKALEWEVEALKNKLQCLEGVQVILPKGRKEETDRLKQRVEELESIGVATSQQVEELKRQHREELKSMQVAASQQVEELKRQHSEELESIGVATSQQVEKLKYQHWVELGQLPRQHQEEVKKQLKNLYETGFAQVEAATLISFDDEEEDAMQLLDVENDNEEDFDFIAPQDVKDSPVSNYESFTCDESGW